jgi:hypothetical protein
MNRIAPVGRSSSRNRKGLFTSMNGPCEMGIDPPVAAAALVPRSSISKETSCTRTARPGRPSAMPEKSASCPKSDGIPSAIMASLSDACAEKLSLGSARWTPPSSIAERIASSFSTDSAASNAARSSGTITTIESSSPR